MKKSRKKSLSRLLRRFDPAVIWAIVTFALCLAVPRAELPADTNAPLPTATNNVAATAASVKYAGVGKCRLVLDNGDFKFSTRYNGYPIEFQEGDIINASCELEALSGEEPWHNAWIAKGILATGECTDFEKVGSVGGLQGVRYGLKRKLVGAVESALKPPISSLLLGMLSGDDAGMPRSFSNKMREVGLTHIIVVSGYNITVIYEGLRRILGWGGRYFSDLFSVIGISAFVWIVGGEPPVLRAAVMAWIQISATVFGRRVTPMRALMLSSIGLLLMHPAWTKSASFHLSFLATLAILLGGSMFDWVPKKLGVVGGFLQQYFLQTVLVMLFTVPYSAWAFGELSVVAVMANLLILPIVEDMMMFGALGIGFAALSRAVSKFFFWLAWIPGWYLLKVVDWLSRMGGGLTEVAISAKGLAGVYCMVGLILLFAKWQMEDLNARE